MNPTDTYRRAVSDQIPSDAVLVKIFRQGSETLATVGWPQRRPRYGLDMPPLSTPTIVPAALKRADDARRIYLIEQVVVHLEDEALWREDWGILE